MNFNFGEVLTKAWQIIWKHKVLWIFGILAGCGQGSGGGNSGGGGNTGFNTQVPDLPPQITQWFNTIEQNIRTYVFIAIGLACIIWIIIIFISTVGKVGLIRGTSLADEGEENLIFGQLFSESMPYVWRMFWLSLIVGLPILVLFSTLIVLLAIGVSGWNEVGLLSVVLVPLFIGCMCLLIPVMFVVGMIIRQSQNAIVLEDMEVMPALSRGWEVFRANLGPIIIMAIILGIIGFVAGLIIAIPIFLIVFPTIFSFVLGEGETFAPFILMAVCMCLYIPVALVLQGILTSYTESAWTLTYMRLTQPKQDDENATIVEANA